MFPGLTLVSKPTPTKVMVVDWVSDKLRAVGPVIPMAVTVFAAVEAATYCPSRRPAIGALAP
jgi:hypothetical protein